MSAFRPIPFADLIRRVFYEYRQYGKILGVPKDKFFQGHPGANLAVNYMGRWASTPLGPAAGPHTQLAQNIVLAWLTGARIIELKTVQILDELDLPRPCIDTQNIGFNVEWSQELRLQESLREYVKAWMVIEMIRSSQLLGEEFSKHYCNTIFDLSIGYDFKGIKSEPMRAYIQELKNASSTIALLREEIPKEFSHLKRLAYSPHIIESVTLSTFHGCPSDEIDHILSHLLTEHGVNVILKLNPTLLGFEEVNYLLHDILGYTNLELDITAFEDDLKFDPAIDMTRDLYHTAQSFGKSLGLKFTNTLVVKNHKSYFSDDVMYMSGTPLHVLALHLLKKMRDALGNLHSRIPMSFSAGIDATNFADVVSLDLVPVTVCTDMLKVPGYEKSKTYLDNLAEQIRTAEAINIADYILKRYDHGKAAISHVFDALKGEAEAEVEVLPEEQRASAKQARHHILNAVHERILNALKENDDSLELLTTDALIITEMLDVYNEKYGESFLLPHTFKELYRSIIAASADLNLETFLDHTIRNPHYTREKNKKAPKKLSRQLGLYDCTSCGRCIRVCPNAANFVYHVAPVHLTYQNYQCSGEQATEVQGGEFVIEQSYQVANFDDCCNACSLCAIHCVETGAPHHAKPTYFGSYERWKESRESGFFVEKENGLDFIAGRLHGKEYTLRHDTEAHTVTFSDGIVEAIFAYPAHTLQRMTPIGAAPEDHLLNMEVYHILLTQLQGVLHEEDVNYVNIKYLT